MGCGHGVPELDHLEHPLQKKICVYAGGETAATVVQVFVGDVDRIEFLDVLLGQSTAATLVQEMHVVLDAADLGFCLENEIDQHEHTEPHFARGACRSVEPELVHDFPKPTCVAGPGRVVPDGHNGFGMGHELAQVIVQEPVS